MTPEEKIIIIDHTEAIKKLIALVESNQGLLAISSPAEIPQTPAENIIPASELARKRMLYGKSVLHDFNERN